MAKLVVEIDTRNASRGVKQLDNLLTQFGRKTDRATTKTKRLEKSFSGLSKSARLLGTAFSGAAIAYGVTQLVKIADTYTNINSRLKLVTDSTEELAKVQAELFEVSQQTGTSFKNNAAAYAKLGLGLSSLNVSSQELLNISTLLNQSLVVSGASTEEASSFMLQYTQALSSGVLAGEEFRAMTESNSYFATKLADALGVSRGELRQMSRDQKLTTDVLRKAMQKMGEDVEKDFAKMPKTVARAMNELKNAFGSIIADTNNASGATTSLADSISDFATAVTDNKDEIISFFKTVVELSTKAMKGMVRFGKQISEIGAGISAAQKGDITWMQLLTMPEGGLDDLLADTQGRIDQYQEEIEKYTSKLEWKTTARNFVSGFVGTDTVAPFDRDIKALQDKISELKRAKTELEHIYYAPGNDQNFVAGPIRTMKPRASKKSIGGGVVADSAVPVWTPTDEEKILLEGYKKELQYIQQIQAASTTTVQKYNEESARTYSLMKDNMITPEERRAYLESLQDDMEKGADYTNSFLQQVQTVGETVSGRLEDGFVRAFEAASTGAKSFGDIAMDVLKSIASEIVRMSVAKPAASFLSGFLTNLVTGAATGAATSGGSTSSFSASGGYWNSHSAKGNVFSGAGISAYSGSVVSQPTSFYANGGNVMGEAGPEAILPLKRGASGKLGVETTGEGQGQPQNVTVQIQAVDAKSFADLTKRNPGAIVGPILQAMQAGNQGLRATMKTVVA